MKVKEVISILQALYDPDMEVVVADSKTGFEKHVTAIAKGTFVDGQDGRLYRVKDRFPGRAMLKLG